MSLQFCYGSPRLTKSRLTMTFDKSSKRQRPPHRRLYSICRMTSSGMETISRVPIFRRKRSTNFLDPQISRNRSTLFFYEEAVTIARLLCIRSSAFHHHPYSYHQVLFQKCLNGCSPSKARNSLAPPSSSLDPSSTLGLTLTAAQRKPLFLSV